MDNLAHHNNDNLPVRLHVLYSRFGWFVGAVDEEGVPFLRESNYYATAEDARVAHPATTH